MSTIKLQEFAFHTGSAASCNPKQLCYQMLPSAQSSTDQVMAECSNNVKLVFFPDAYHAEFEHQCTAPYFLLSSATFCTFRFNQMINAGCMS